MDDQSNVCEVVESTEQRERQSSKGPANADGDDEDPASPMDDGWEQDCTDADEEVQAGNECGFDQRVVRKVSRNRFLGRRGKQCETPSGRCNGEHCKAETAREDRQRRGESTHEH